MQQEPEFDILMLKQQQNIQLLLHTMAQILAGGRTGRAMRSSNDDDDDNDIDNDAHNGYRYDRVVVIFGQS